MQLSYGSTCEEIVSCMSSCNPVDLARLCLKSLLCHKKAQEAQIGSVDFELFVPLCG